MKIYIARHGQNEDNALGILNGHRDLPLTDLGRDQAKITAKKIESQHINFTAVLCSPLVRAKETAEIISTITATPKANHRAVVDRT